ncbi:MAG: 50S ribosomal protein L35 [Aquificota bacterium]|uniref:Large ribosomal subunit protein bL35 n=1 Tax=Thermosulfidibacter takaii TaxID=412593 RepID=A0A7C0U5C4_9BACT|nr:MAG: 50S ribosomal protein L35 [Aquificota bacterium]RLD99523.1 MAG: 50S ribosomal protein L35 [Aquificota bacterium]RLE00138.1 MAG: 50S ribosomal protein L35 [Aquificota bacterium]HDD52492.1 50S ribosomal protein L35 [Thermosulfidibacter takaii]
MPKMKTNRSAAKRFKVTASGKLKRRKAGKSHLLEEKPARRKRRLRKAALVGKEEMERMKRLLPYAF